MKGGIEPMQSGSRAGAAVRDSRSLWFEVCRAGGTPLPDLLEAARFLGGLPGDAKAELKQPLLLFSNGRESILN